MITCEVSALTKAFNGVKPFIPARATVPILSHVRIRAESGEVKVSGTDLNAVGDFRAPAKIKKKIDVAAPFNLVSTFVSNAAGEITLEMSDGRLLMKSSRRRAKIAILPGADWPEMNHEGGEEIGAASEIARAMQFCRHAMEKDSSRHQIACIHIGDGVVEATDGASAHFAPVTASSDICIPSEYVGPMLDAISGEGARLFASASFWRVAGENFSISGKLVDGQFPNLASLRGAETDHVLSADRASLIAAVRAASLGAGNHIEIKEVDQTPTVLCSGKADRGGFEGEASADFEGTFEATDVAPLKFAADRLLATLNAATASTVSFHTGKSGRAKVEIRQGDDLPFALVMQLRF